MKYKNLNNLKIIISIFFLLCLLLIIFKDKYAFNYDDKSEINNNLKVCLCLLCKQENLYINYFIDFYKKLGFNHIFLYDNNDIGGEKIEKVISEEIRNNYITIINFRGYRGKYGGPILAASYDCYEKNNKFYDWIAFFDVDEYLILNPTNLSIQAFLNNSRYKNCESVRINWKLFTDNNQLDYEDKPLNKRFIEEVEPSYKANEIFKVILRGNLSNYLARKSFSNHDLFKSNNSCDSNGEISKGYHIKPPKYKFAILNHYYTKSINEFCKKIKKGHSFYHYDLSDKKILNDYFNIFFKHNKKTKEKVTIFNKEFNSTFK